MAKQLTLHISTRGVDYTHHSTERPPSPDFQTLQLPCRSDLIFCIIENLYKIGSLLRKSGRAIQFFLKFWETIITMSKAWEIWDFKFQCNKFSIKGSIWKQQKSSLNQTLFNLFFHFGKSETSWNRKNFLKLNGLKSKNYCITLKFERLKISSEIKGIFKLDGNVLEIALQLYSALILERLKIIYLFKNQGQYIPLDFWDEVFYLSMPSVCPHLTTV